MKYIQSRESTGSFIRVYPYSIFTRNVTAQSQRVKVGASILLLNYINLSKLCDGTRLKVKTLSTCLIEATIITGVGPGRNSLYSENRIPWMMDPTRLPP